jgi:hypothetical protein
MSSPRRGINTLHFTAMGDPLRVAWGTSTTSLGPVLPTLYLSLSALK